MAQHRQVHWRDRAIGASEIISDAFDVAKAYGAHVANWVLFFCLVANLIEMVSPDFRTTAGMVIVGIQSITLDVAGFGLTAMAASARRRGDTKSARKADIMGWTLITVMAITVALITVAAFDKDLTDFVNQADNGLMLVRVIVTVFYGHIVHQLREESTAHENRLADLMAEVSTLQNQLRGKAQEVLSVQGQFANQQKAFAGLQFQLEEEKSKVTGIQHKCDLAQQRAADLEQEMQSDQSGVIGQRRELTSAKLQIADLQSQLDVKQQALKQEQLLVVNLRREVERLQQNEALRQRSEAKNEAKNEAKHLASPAQNEAGNEAKHPASPAQNEATPGASHHGTEANRVLFSLNGGARDKEALQAEVFRLADEGNLSSYEIAKLVDRPAKTIQRWLRERGGGSGEAENEATGTEG